MTKSAPKAQDPDKFRTLKVSYDAKKKRLTIEMWPVHPEEITERRDILVLDVCHRLITNVKKHLLGETK